MNTPALLLAVVPVVSAPPSGAQGGLDAAFKAELEKLAAQADTPAMGKLVASKTQAAVDWIVATCEALAEGSDDEKEAFAQVLRDAWKAGIGSEFADREYEAMKGLGSNRRDRNDLVSRMEAADSEFRGNLVAKDGFAFQNVIDELDVVAPGLEQTGDYYRAAQAWRLQASATDEEVRGGAADLYKACAAYARVLAAYDHLDLKDAAYAEVAKRHKKLADAGYGEARSAPEAPSSPEAAGATESGPSVTVATRFGPVPSIDQFERPNYMADEVHLLWAPLPLREKSTSADFVRIEGAPKVFRIGASDVRVDTNGNGQGDENDLKLALAGNPLLVEIELGTGADARPWAFLAQVGGKQDQYQRLEVNVEPNDDAYTVYTLPAASVVGELNGVPFRVIDESMDAQYGNDPMLWGEIGLTRDHYQPEVDSIVLGASKRAKPWSQVQQFGDRWYRLAPDKAGSSIQATPLTVETGRLKLDMKGPKPDWVVVRGTGELLSQSYFDIAEGGSKGVEVPVGRYTLFYGEVRKGKKKQVQKTLILPGKTTPSFEVTAGKTSTVPLGAPFGFDFSFRRDGQTLTVEGRSVVVTGRSDERYERPWNCVPRPEVSWRKVGTKSASKPETMPVLGSTMQLQEFGWEAAWAPLDLAIDLKNESGAVEVHLAEKRHAVFGKVESDWKGE